MIVKNGTLMLAPVTNIRDAWRTSAVFSISGPTMIPGVSHNESSGMSKEPLVGAAPVLDRTLKVRQILLRGLHRFGLVLDGDVDDAVARLHVDRADFFGAEDPESAAFDHRRAAHPDVRVLRRDDDVAAA